VSGPPPISLPGTGITTSVLGFGCSRLLGPTSRGEALRLLETAYDAGIRHFDVARAYGSGDAEAVLGEFLAGRRDQVTVTTKFGMRPMQIVAERALLLATARRLMKTSPAARRFLGRQGARLVKRGGFSVDDANESLTISLRELRTDYVDILLLHDCAATDCTPELLEFLHGAVAAGKVRVFGVGTDVESARAVDESAPEFAGVLQFEHSILRPAIDEVDPEGRRALITHSAFAGLSRLRRYLDENPGARRRWSDELGTDIGRGDTLAAAAIQYAVRSNRRGPTLFSSTRPENIVRNAAVAHENPSLSLDNFAVIASGALQTAL
jgi:aryl-alcohol dehydrogenase-like predicted oxidoreductase